MYWSSRLNPTGGKLFAEINLPFTTKQYKDDNIANFVYCRKTRFFLYKLVHTDILGKTSTIHKINRKNKDLWLIAYPRLQFRTLQIRTSGSVLCLHGTPLPICPEQADHTWHTASRGHLGNHAHAHRGWNFGVQKEDEVCAPCSSWSWTKFGLKHEGTSRKYLNPSRKYMLNIQKLAQIMIIWITIGSCSICDGHTDYVVFSL